MKISKYTFATSLAVAGLLFSGSASALPGFSKIAPESTVNLCVAQIGEQANYEGARRVHHEVESKERRVSGHKLLIKTTVFGVDDDAAIREYMTVCAVSGQSETTKFRMREKSI